MLSRFPKISPKRTGKNIQDLMLKNGLSVKDLQEAFGFEYPQAIYKWFRGESLPNIDNLVVLATLFHTTIDKIIAINR
ncbi:MAG: helix-turn-helix transcriptional regulator [Eubacteriales bacterium]|nr:helix-turn-helix transcriptional regulator [Eubacteriales bacterium]